MNKYKIVKKLDSNLCWKTIVDEKLNFIANETSPEIYSIQTSDGASFDLNKDQLDIFIKEFSQKKWFTTKVIECPKIELLPEDIFILENYPRHEKEPYFFGSFAIRKGDQFITTKRGKTSISNDYTIVNTVDLNYLTVLAEDKATLNAPLIYKIFLDNPEINYIIHGHDKLGITIHDNYEFPGTLEELNSVPKNESKIIINLKHHGYMACFKNYEDCKNFLIFTKNSQVNWQTYHQDFPERYLNASYFDEYLKSINYSKYLTALDIGGGYQGTLALKNKVITDIFDPFVTKPNWIRDQVTLEDKTKYDIVVARGSFNYLSESDIITLNTKVAKNGILIFNTFKNPPATDWKSRPFTSKNGTGIEKYRLYHGLIDHVTEYPNKTIHHYFYYHSIEVIKNLLFEFSLEIIDYGNNSILVKGIKK